MPKKFFQHRIAEYQCPCGKGHVSQSEQKLMVWLKIHSKYCEYAVNRYDASSLDVINLDEETGKKLKNKINL